jgi:hypothetical protein
MRKVQRWIAAPIALVLWAALALQFVLVIAKAGELGVGISFAILVYAAFFTIQTNFMAAIITSLAAMGVKCTIFSSRFKTAIAVYITVGGLVFLVLLRPVLDNTGWQAVADALLHYVTPILYGLYWLVAVSKRDLRWRDVAIWMIYPLCYFPAVLAFSLWFGFVPYPFFDLNKLGVMGVLLNAAAISLVFLAGGLIAVAAGRYLGRVGYEGRDAPPD